MLPLAWLAFVAAAPGDRQPTTYGSPSGSFELFVDPTDREGLGPSTCRLCREGTVVWGRELPFTFEEAVVDDHGTAAGFGYVGTPPHGRDKEFFVAIVGLDGAVAYEERVQMQPSRFLHTAPDPKAAGALLQPELGRFIVRVQDPDVNRQSESWWLYDLLEAAPIGKTEPRQRFAEAGGLRNCVCARAVPGTPLILSQWYAWPSRGCRFVLLGPELDPLWSVDLPTDYMLEDDDARSALLRRIWDGAAVLSVEERRFELHFVEDAQRVTLAVEPSDATAGDWSVSELGRQPQGLEPIAGSAPEAAVADLPVVDLQLLGTARLGSGDEGESAIHDITEFDVAADGRIGFIRRDEGGFTHVRLAPDRTLVDEVPIDGSAFGDVLPRTWAPLPRGDWLLVVDALDGGEGSSWRVAGDSGRAVAMGTRECGFGDAVETWDGGMAFLHAPGDSLTGCDEAGRSLWTRDLGRGSPEDLGVNQAGQCAVIDQLGNTVQVFGSGGILEQVFDLDEILPGKIRYLAGIEPDLDGGWLIYDFNAAAPIWRLSATGELIAGFVPRFADGSTATELPDQLRREADGNLWTSDRASLLRLDEDGVVVEVVGAEPNAERLTDPESMHVDHLGRVLVQDGRSGAIHVFDHSGRRLAVAALAPEEVARVQKWGGHFAVRGDGGFHVEVQGGTVEFGPDAARLGPAELPLKELVYQPGLGSAWGRADGGGVLRLASDRQVLRTLTRHDDGTWMRVAGLDVAHDGSLCLLTGVEGEGGQRLSWYDPTGELLRTLRVPGEPLGRKPVAGRGWIALANWEPEIVLVDLATGSVAKGRVDAEDENTEWRFGASHDGTELWAIEESGDELMLHRFAVLVTR